MNKRIVEVTEELVNLLQEEQKEIGTLIEFLTESATRPFTQRPNMETLSKGTRKTPVARVGGERADRVDSVLVPLLKEKGPMTIEEITKEMVSRGYNFKGKTPLRSVATSLSRSYKFKRRNSKYEAKQRVMRRKRKGKRITE